MYTTIEKVFHFPFVTFQLNRECYVSSRSSLVSWKFLINFSLFRVGWRWDCQGEGAPIDRRKLKLNIKGTVHHHGISLIGAKCLPVSQNTLAGAAREPKDLQAVYVPKWVFRSPHIKGLKTVKPGNKSSSLMRREMEK